MEKITNSKFKDDITKNEIILFKEEEKIFVIFSIKKFH